MGLDITAYERLTPVTSRDSECEPGHTRIWINAEFPGRAGELKDGVYRYEGELLTFRAGSYGGYNDWRRWLAALVGTTPEDVWNSETPSGPFVELINFSDCEGTIGTTVAAKLAGDFAQWEARAMEKMRAESPDVIDWHQSVWTNWRRAFEIAARGGAVTFH
jgi:hypothetical protein